MPLQDTDVTLVSRNEVNAQATMSQVKDYVLDGLGVTTESLTWTSYPPTGDHDISSDNDPDDEGNWNFRDLNRITVSNIDLLTTGDYIIPANLTSGFAGTYEIEGRNTNSETLALMLVGASVGLTISEGDKFLMVNLGSEFGGEVPTTFQVFTTETSPTIANTGDLWFQPLLVISTFDMMKPGYSLMGLNPIIMVSTSPMLLMT